MGIMTRDAGNPLVSGIVAAAMFKTVGLKTHVYYAMSIRRQDIVRCTMAGSAKVIQIAWVKPARIEDVQVFPVTVLNGLHVLASRSVAIFTGHARPHEIEM